MGRGEIDWNGVALAISQIAKIGQPTKIDEMEAAYALRKEDRDERRAYQKTLHDESKADRIEWRENERAYREGLEKKRIADAKLAAEKKVKEDRMYKAAIKEMFSLKDNYHDLEKELITAETDLNNISIGLGNIPDKYNTEGALEALNKLDLSNIEDINEGIEHINTMTNELVGDLADSAIRNSNVEFGKNLYKSKIFEYTDADGNPQSYSFDQDKDGTFTSEEIEAGLERGIQSIIDQHGEGYDTEGIRQGFYSERSAEEELANEIKATTDLYNLDKLINPEEEDVNPVEDAINKGRLDAIRADAKKQYLEKLEAPNGLSTDANGDIAMTEEVSDALDYVKDMYSSYTEAEIAEMTGAVKTNFNKAVSILVDNNLKHYVIDSIDINSLDNESDWYFQSNSMHVGISQEFYKAVKDNQIPFGNLPEDQNYHLNMELKRDIEFVHKFQDEYDNGTLTAKQEGLYQEAIRGIEEGRKIYISMRNK
jgi:hypothetical protein